MSCDKHLLNLHWEHHTWQRRVLSTEYVPTQETNMWSRTVYGRSVRCNTQYVCEACGKTRGDAGCICDTEEGESCAIRLACLDGSSH
jgi:hypothetical protein